MDKCRPMSFSAGYYPQARKPSVRGRETQLVLYAGLSRVGTDDHRNSGLYMRSRSCIFEAVESVKIVEGGQTKILLSYNIQL